MENKPLEQNQEPLPLKIWMDNQNINTLFDISIWSMRIVWSIGLPPSQIYPLIPSFFSALKGCVPWDLFTPVQRGWGGPKYFVRNKYLHQLQPFPPSWHSAIWKQIWHSNGIPKVNTFSWLMVNEKILTTKNLQKEESKAHLNVLYAFQMKRWSVISSLATVSLSKSSIAP